MSKQRLDDLARYDHAALQASLLQSDVWDRAMEEELERAVQRLRQNAPRSTGELASGFYVTVLGKRAELGNTAPHAGFLRRKGARRPYVDEVHAEVNAAVSRAVDRWLKAVVRGDGGGRG